METKQSCKRICSFVRIGRLAFLWRLGSGLTDLPGCVVNSRGVWTRSSKLFSFYRWRPVPAMALPVLFQLPKPHLASTQMSGHVSTTK